MDPIEKSRINAGRKLFINELGAKLSFIDTLDGPVDFSKAQQVYLLLHNIKGSAPVFGLSRLGNIAEQLMLQWEWVTDNDLAPINETALSAKILNVSVNSHALFAQLRSEYEINRKLLELYSEEPIQTIQASSHKGSSLLIVDDDEALRSYLVRSLNDEGYETDGAVNIDDAKGTLYQNTYDLIILNLRMYPQSGYDLFYFLKEDPSLKWIPLIVLSEDNDITDKVRCLQLGADDYVTKPFQYEEFMARIYSLLRRTKNFAEMAFRDPLTGVSNRRYFDNQMQLELKRIERYPAPISIAFIDIDHFKKINDTYGHSIGDLVLQAMAYTLQENVRSTDLVARFGGEEFVIILPNTSAHQAKTLINSILFKFRSAPLTEHEGQSFNVTFSAGVAEWQPGLNLQKWIQFADETMYKSKQQGRNRCLVYEYIQGDNTSSLGKKRVLIVDDDRMIRSILLSKLAHLPVDLVSAEDGEMALGILKTQVIDLCILDAIMPKMDGFSLLLAFQKNAEVLNEHMRVIMLSGRINEDDIARGIMLGADHYIAKPFSMVELETLVKKLLLID
jgi:two-component system, cell cycle response regulator